MMDDLQKQKLLNLFGSQHVAIISTQGREWPTATMQAFAETPELELLFIMGDSEKYRNLIERPGVTVQVDDRDKGDIATFRVNRATIYGTATEIPRGDQWNVLKDHFIRKNPFEERFFSNDALKMIRVTPRRISFAGADYRNFKVEL
jgi:nitroimidazol reductase NimA-like FMN-containing flavoprotein (pyridoxamine 5'-phosphate oxidase superfamily)